MNTAIDKTAFEQKWVTRDLIHSLEDSMAIRFPMESLGSDNAISADHHVRKAMGSLVAAKAYLWLVSHPADYANVIRTRHGTVKISNAELNAAGFSIDLKVDDSRLHVTVMDTNNKPLFSGSCDLNESI